MFARSKRNLTWFEVGPTSLPPLPALHKATMSVHAAFGRPSALPLPRSSALSSSAPSVATKGLPNRHHVAGGPSDPRQRRAGSSTPPNTIIAQQALLPSTNAATDSAATLPAPVSVQNRLKRPFSCANNQQPPSSPAPAASSEKKGLIVRRPSGRASLEKDVPTAAAKKNADSTRKVSDPGGVGRKSSSSGDALSSATSSPATPKAGRKDSPKVATSSKVSSLRKTSTNSSHSTSDHNGSSPGISKKISRAGSAVSATSVDRKPVVLVARSTSAAGDKKLASHLAHAPLPNTKTAALPIKTSEIRSGPNRGSDRPPVAVKKVTPPSNTTTTSNHLNNNLAIRKTSGGSGVIGKVGSGLTAAKQPKSSSPGVAKKNAINSTVSSGVETTFNHRAEPDLVKSAGTKSQQFSFLETRITSLECDLLRNQTQLDSKQVAFESLISQLQHNAKGFEAMAVLVNHFSNISSMKSSADRQNQRCEKLYERLQQKDEEIAKLKQYYEELVRQLEISRNSSISEVEFQEAVRKLEERHNKVLEKLLLEHKLHLESLEQSHTAHLKVVEDDYLEKVEASEARFNAALEESEEKWRQKMNAELAERADEVEATIQDWRKKEEGWEEAKKALEDSVYNLRADLKDRDDALAASAARGGSKSSTGSTCSSASVASGRLSSLPESVTAEVDSLKAVMDIRAEENRKLRKDNIRLEETLVDYKKTVKKLKKANLLLEDYKAQLDSKLDVERKLSEEKQRLERDIERETSTKQKLIMENEELQWKIRTSLDVTADMMSLSMIDTSSNSHQASSGGLGNASDLLMCQSYHPSTATSSGAVHTSTPLKGLMEGLRSHSPSTSVGTATEGATPSQSLPPFAAKSKFRPLSAPPGRLDCHNRFLREGSPFKARRDREAGTGSAAISGPESPRVLEVVEKCDSLSWKLEYDGGSETEDNPSHSSASMHASSHHSNLRSSAGALAARQHASPSPVTMMSKSLIEPSAASLWCDEMRRVPPVGAPSSTITADCIPECEMESQQQPDSLEDTADETDDERQLDRRFPSSSVVKSPLHKCNSDGGGRNSRTRNDLSDLVPGECKALSISDFDLGDLSSCCSEIGDDDDDEEVTTPQIEEMEAKMLVFNTGCHSTGHGAMGSTTSKASSTTSGCLSSGHDSAVSSPDADDVTLKESLAATEHQHLQSGSAAVVVKKQSKGGFRFTPDSVIKTRRQPKYHHSNSSAMASSLQGINMFGLPSKAGSKTSLVHVAAGESLVSDAGSDCGAPTPDLTSSHDDSF